MKKKRSMLLIVATSLVLVAALLMVAGCGGTEESSTTVSEVATTAGEVTQTTGETTATTGETTGTTISEQGVKFAVATVGSRTDESWSQRMFESYEQIKAEHPDFEMTFSDLVPFNDLPTYLTNLGQQGFNLFYSDNAWYEAVKAVAPQFPDMKFYIDSLTAEQMEIMPDNVYTGWGPLADGPYLAGVAAGMTTKTKTVAVVLGMAGYPELCMATYSFFDGARSVDPSIKCVLATSGDWVDIQKGYDAAMGVIDAGADVVMHYADDSGLGVIKAGVERNVSLVGLARDQSHLAPDNMITSYFFDHYIMMKEFVDGYLTGTLNRDEVTQFGLAHGDPVIAPLTNVSDETKAKVAEVEASIKDGSFTPYKAYTPEEYDKFIK